MLFALLHIGDDAFAAHLRDLHLLDLKPTLFPCVIRWMLDARGWMEDAARCSAM